MRPWLSALRDLGFYVEHGIPEDLDDPSDPRIRTAVLEYQAANLPAINALAMGHDGAAAGRGFAIADGDAGFGTINALTSHSFCDCRTLSDEALSAEAHNGDTSGYWGPCHRSGIYYSVDYEGRSGLPMPGWLREIWPEVTEHRVELYRSLGVRLIETDWNHPTQDENIRVSFFSRPPGPIGIGWYGPKGTCRAQREIHLNLRYRPSSSRSVMVPQWTRLDGHEFGHVLGCQHHTRGGRDLWDPRRGMMYPQIYRGPWEGVPPQDPCHATFRSYYGPPLEEGPVDPSQWHDVNLEAGINWRRVRVNIAGESASPFLLTQKPEV